nr:hypothetical protein Iba_chr05dCG14790 [Ipomoea batatas]GMD01999.1 hypothetical protein Iba_chr05fCG12450 [Ipomoea batatas]
MTCTTILDEHMLPNKFNRPVAQPTEFPQFQCSTSRLRCLRLSAEHTHRLNGAAPQRSAARSVASAHRSLRPRPVDPQQPAPVPTSASPTAPPTSPTPPGTIPSPSVHCPNSSDSTT